MRRDFLTNENGEIYNQIGSFYSQTRREDPAIYNKIIGALGNSKTVINIGAGTGSYEPRDRTVVAVEPSEVMIKQRSFQCIPSVRAMADSLPFIDKSFDASMTVISIHHWHPNQRKGIEEMRRVARNKVLIVTYDSRVCEQMWLTTDYIPETANLDRDTLPTPEDICEWLNCNTKVETIPISRDTPDWMFGSFWAHPERVLDPIARASTSGFSRQPKKVIDRVVANISRDLESGKWDEKYGHLRELVEYDAGLRIITADLTS